MCPNHGANYTKKLAFLQEQCRDMHHSTPFSKWTCTKLKMVIKTHHQL